jgi:hypothetical protein
MSAHYDVHKVTKQYRKTSANVTAQGGPGGEPVKLWQLFPLTCLVAASFLVGIVILDRAKTGPRAGTCQHDGTGISICPYPADK